MQEARHFIDGVDVPHRNHAVLGHIGEERNLLALIVRNRPIGTAQEHVGLNADFAQFLHRMLGRLGLELTRGGDPGHIGQVHKGGVGWAHLQAHLPHRLQEGERFDIAHRAANFYDGDVDV